jgi:fructose-1,6-bisphosphatase
VLECYGFSQESSKSSPTWTKDMLKLNREKMATTFETHFIQTSKAVEERKNPYGKRS